MLHLNTGCGYKKGIYSSGLDRGRAWSLVMLWTKSLLHISSRDALTQSTRAGAGPSAPRFSNLPKPKLTGLHCMTARVYHGSRQCGGDPPEEPGPPTMDGRDYLTRIFIFLKPPHLHFSRRKTPAWERELGRAPTDDDACRDAGIFFGLGCFAFS